MSDQDEALLAADLAEVLRQQQDCGFTVQLDSDADVLDLRRNVCVRISRENDRRSHDLMILSLEGLASRLYKFDDADPLRNVLGHRCVVIDYPSAIVGHINGRSIFECAREYHRMLSLPGSNRDS